MNDLYGCLTLSIPKVEQHSRNSDDDLLLLYTYPLYYSIQHLNGNEKGSFLSKLTEKRVPTSKV
jgi:hypothetical protein